MKQIKVLIIGGAGFIGLNIANYLSKKKNYTIHIADNFFRGKKDISLNYLLAKENVFLIEIEATNLHDFEKLDKDYDYVYMLASVVGVEYTEKIPDRLIYINTSLIINTLEWLKTSKVRKVLFSSTSENYAGTVEAFNYDVPTKENVPLCIGDIGHPRFTYAVTKMLGESAFLNYSRIHDFNVSIVRYHNVYGPRMGFKHVIPQVVQRFLKNESPFKIYGYSQTRAFNFVDDAVHGTVLAMESIRSDNEIFHIGDMTAEITIEELVTFIGDYLAYTGSFVLDKTHSGSVSRRCPDTTKAEKLLGYKPKVDWKTGVRATVDWYVEYINGSGEIFE